MLSNLKILVVNDDGINGEGLKYLVKKLYDFNKNIIIIAPSKENSAISHAMTIKKGLEFKKEESLYENIPTYSLSGTPADCVKFALSHLNYQADLVISGINNGLNIGTVISYSGTVAAAIEGALYGIKSIAISVEEKSFNNDYNIKDCIEYIYKSNILKHALVINVNIPIDSKGNKVTTLGTNSFNTSFLKKEDGLYYVQGTSQGENEPNLPSSDVLTYKNKYASYTPLTIDRTDYSLINKHKI